ncbi:MAG: hypothetical protein KIT09_06480 [Bryobacteraceae bacterium]|nr:hypothetical protein [Bryobacteraceae bacterium]
MPLPSELLGLARMATGLRPFARSFLCPAECRRRVLERMRTRETRFVEILHRALRSSPNNPYRRLLGCAGAEEGDVRSVALKDGLEAALEKLHQAGVFITWEEFKGRAPARRGGQTFQFQESQFDNPLTRIHFVGSSGGSSGQPVRVKVDLEFQAESAANWGVWFDEQGWAGRPLVFWTPTHTGLANRYLMCAKIGYRYVKWFAMADMRTPMDRLRSGAVHWLSQLVLGFPPAEPADLEHADRVLAYLAGMVEQGEKPLINTSPSAAARLCQRAVELGRPLEGASFLLGAEPVTPERRASMEASGARCCPTYGTSETGWVGAQFEGAQEHDEVHVFRDSYAVLPRALHGDGAAGPRAILFTSLVRAAPKVLINVELGDSAYLQRVDGTRPARAFGYDLTLHTIRSFRKLTAFGVTLAVADLYPILESELPSRFGGQVGDYQLVETQDGNGESSLELRVDPRLGKLNEAAITEALFRAISEKRSYYGFMTEMIRTAGALKVERKPPECTAAGKALPVMPAPARTKTG